MFAVTSVFSIELYYPLPYFSFILQGILQTSFYSKLVCYSRNLWPSYFCIAIPYNEKDIFFFFGVLESVLSLPRTSQLELLWHQGLGHGLGLQ